MSRPNRLRFAAFLAPHHPLGENPTYLLRRDLDLVEYLDHLGLDEFWCGEHHSTGWEMIGSPEVFLAAAAARTSRIRLGTGVISLPYHHPFTVAQRMVQLDHQSRGRVIFGTGPGALPSDAAMLGIDPMRQRDMQDEAIGVIKRLLEGERVTHQTDWFELRDAALHFLPLQEQMPMAVASSLSPSGMRLAGKYGIGVLSIASNSSEGLAALPTQWDICERAAAEFGGRADRSQWRVMMSFHLAETEQEARDQSVDGLQRWHNDYNVRVLARPGAAIADDKWKFMDQATGRDGSTGSTVIGTPEMLVDAIKRLQEITGGFGTVMGFCHDWASPENQKRSWELFARYVMPEFNGVLSPMRRSADWVTTNQSELMGAASKAIVAQVKRDPKAVEEFAKTIAMRQGLGAGASAAAGAALGSTGE